MTRRRLMILIPLAACAAGPRPDSEQEVWDLFASLAGALSEGNAGEFLKAFDPAMPGYEKLRAGVTGLLREAQVECSIAFVSNEGDDRNRRVEVDWILRIDERQDAGGSVRRRQSVKGRVEKRGKRWWIEGLEPLDFFAPPKL